MTKQEKISRFTRNYLVGCIHGATVAYGDLSGYDKSTVDYQAEELLDELSKLGVVIKVDKELPETADWIKCPCDDCTAENKLIDEWGYFCDLTCGKRSYWIARCRGHQEVFQAGYVAVEPLIDVV